MCAIFDNRLPRLPDAFPVQAVAVPESQPEFQLLSMAPAIRCSFGSNVPSPNVPHPAVVVACTISQWVPQAQWLVGWWSVE